MYHPNCIIGNPVWLSPAEQLPPPSGLHNDDNPSVVHPPEGGWKVRTFYAVDVSYGKANPRHRAILYTGFLDKDGAPAGYSFLIGTSGDMHRVPEAHAIVAIAELFSDSYPQEDDDDD